MKEEKSLKTRVLKNIFFSETTSIIARLGALAFTIIIARTFLPELFGIYSLALTIILTVFILSDMGLGSTITRYLSDSIGKRKVVETRSRLWFLLKIKFFLALVTSVLLFLFAGPIAEFFSKPELLTPLRIGSTYLFLESLRNLVSNIFIAFQKLNYSTITEAVFQFSRILLLFVSFYVYKSVEGIFIILSISLLISLLVSLKIVAKKYPFLIKGKKIPVERRRMLKFSGFLALSSISLLIFGNVDKLVLGYFLNAEFVGFYNAIFSVVAGVLGVVSIASAFFPVFTQLRGKTLERVFKKTFHYISLMAFPAAIGLSFVIVPLLKILYGTEYVPSQYSFPILLTSIFLSLLILESIFSSIYSVLLNAKEEPNIPAWTTIGTSIINITLNIILVYYWSKINPAYGLIGASLATFASRYVGMFILVFLSAKKMNIFPEKNSIIKPLFASLIMLGYLFLFKYLFSLNIITGILMILSAAVVYFLVIFLIKAISLQEIENIFRHWKETRQTKFT